MHASHGDRFAVDRPQHHVPARVGDVAEHAAAGRRIGLHVERLDEERVEPAGEPLGVLVGGEARLTYHAVRWDQVREAVQRLGERGRRGRTRGFDPGLAECRCGA
ncbi:hypothetical protein JCM12141A_54060 [Mycolicibacterium hodleri]